MLIRESISGYRHIDFGNIKLAFTQVCNDELFKDVYFAANALYYVDTGSATFYGDGKKMEIKEGEIVLIRQHSKLDIKKHKGSGNKDFRSIIFYLFPDFVTEFIKEKKAKAGKIDFPELNLIHLGKNKGLKDFCESLLPLFEKQQQDNSTIKKKTFEALHYLSENNKDFLGFLITHSKPIKIDLYEFMIHVSLYSYSVNELAKLTGRSLSAFKRDFHSIFETTPHQWLLDKKVDYAEKLLSRQGMKASDIYLLLGFNELSHFSAAFKKRKGISPSQLTV